MTQRVCRWFLGGSTVSRCAPLHGRHHGEGEARFGSIHSSNRIGCNESQHRCAPLHARWQNTAFNCCGEMRTLNYERHSCHFRTGFFFILRETRCFTYLWAARWITESPNGHARSQSPDDNTIIYHDQSYCLNLQGDWEEASSNIRSPSNKSRVM